MRCESSAICTSGEPVSLAPRAKYGPPRLKMSAPVAPNPAEFPVLSAARVPGARFAMEQALRSPPPSERLKSARIQLRRR